MSTSAQPDGGHPHAAGAFDVRNVIAGLIGFYGVVLVILGLFADTDDDRAKTGDVNANLWAGIVMVVVALAFFAWTRWRPIVVDEAALAAAKADIDRTAHH
jgi:drug/metabolite transporter (DMT)-like permease